MTLGYFLQFLIRYFSEKRWANFCESVPRDFAFPQWAHARIFLPETLPKSPSQTFLGQCVMLSWVKERTISRCLPMLKSRIRTQKKNPRPKCILILHNYQFCRALNKTIVFLVKHLSRMYDDKLYLFQTAKVYLETNVTGLHNILLCLSTNFLYAIYVQRECEIPGEHFQYTELQVYVIRVIHVNCFCVCVCVWKNCICNNHA